jgi:hypothetical protein
MKIDQVTDIFEQLNTKGKPLTVFDLLIARLYNYDIDLRDLWDTTGKNYPSIFRYSKAIPDKMPIYILQAISLCYDKNSSARRADILDIYKNIYQKSTDYKFEQHWQELSGHMDTALKRLENMRDGFGVNNEREMPYEPMIPVLTALLKLVESQANQKDCFQKIGKWYWSSVFTNAYSASADSQMTTDYKEMKEWFNDESKVPKTIRRMGEEFGTLHLREVQSKSNSKYKGVMSLIALEGAQDLATYQKLENARANNQDHLFPKSSYSNLKNVNSILNMTWLSADTNKMKSYKKPSVYLQDIISNKYSGNEEELIKVFATHLVSKEAYDCMRQDNFEQFLVQREQSILSKLARILEIEYSGFEKNPKNTSISPSIRAQFETNIHSTSSSIFSLISECNKICISKGKDTIFVPTNTMVSKIADMSELTSSETGFGNFVDALFQIFYEGSASLSRIPEQFIDDNAIGITIKYLRNDLRHDLEHGDANEVLKKKTKVAKIYERYTNKTALASLEPADFPKMQLQILNELNQFLTKLKQFCTDHLH